MYFESRSRAGIILAKQLIETYRYKDCAVVSVSNGGVLVGEQIASRLHCVLMLLLSKEIEVPGEGVSFGAVSQMGDFTYNSEFSTGEIEEYASEFHGYLDDQKRQTYSELNRLIGEGGTVDKELLRNRNIILVSDGLSNSNSVKVALDFLKSIRIKKLIVAAPVAAIGVVDVLHVDADELHLLDVRDNFLGTDHYFDDNTVPTLEESIKKINQTILNWR